MAGSIAAEQQESNMSHFTSNVSSQISQMSREEIASVLVWIEEIRDEAVQRLSQMSAEDSERVLVEEAFVEVDGLAKALRGR